MKELNKTFYEKDFFFNKYYQLTDVCMFATDRKSEFEKV